MAYVEKYYAQWKDYGGTIHEIKLLQDGASAGTTEIAVVQPIPYTHDIRGSKDAPIKNQIYGSEIKFNFVISSTGISAIDDIFESEYREWKVEHYYDSVLDWAGWLQPNNYSRIFVSEGDYYLISLSAVDGLANLKDIEFVNFTTGDQYEDRVSIIQTIKRALEHNDIALNFRIAMATWCSNDSLMLSTDQVLDKATCDSRRFTKTEEGRIVNTNCYGVISELLEPFNSYLIQSQGEYWIVNSKDYFPTVFKILWTTLVIDSTQLVDMRTDITGSESTQLRNRGEIQKIKPLKTVEVSFRDRNVGDNLLSNGDFSSGATNWTNVGYTSFNVVSEEGRLEYVTDDDTGAYLKYADIAITPTGEDDYLAIEIDCKLISASYEPLGDDRPPRIQIQLYTAAGAHVGSSTLKSLGDDWSKLTVQIAISEVTNYQIRIYIIEHPTSWVTASITAIDNVRAVAIYQSADITFDRHFKVTNIDSVFTGVEKIELNFGDSTGDSDIAAFKISGTRTKTWNRWLQTEDISINILSAQNIIEDYAQYKDYLRLVIIDNYFNDTPRIFPHRLITISGEDYRIVSQVATYGALARKEISVELVRSLRDSVNTSVIQSTLSTVDGNSTSQEIAVPVSGGVTDHGQLTGLEDDDHPQYDNVLTFTGGLVRTLNTVKLVKNGNIWYVSSTGDDTTGDGSKHNPYLTLQKAHDVAVAGDTIKITGKWNSYATAESPTFTKTLYIDGRESALADLTGTITLSGSQVLTLIDFQVFGKVLGGTTGWLTLQGKSLIFSKGSTCFQLNIEDHSKMNLEDVVVQDKLQITGGVCSGVGTITCDYFLIDTTYVPNSISASSTTKDCTLTNSFVGGDIDTGHDLIQRNSVIVGDVTVASGGVHTIQNQYLSTPNRWHVSASGDDTIGDGSRVAPYLTLQKAHDVASSGDVIKIINAQDGSFFPSESPTFTKSLIIDATDGLGPAISDLVGIVGDLTLTGTINVTLLGFFVLGKVIGGTTGSVVLLDQSTISILGSTFKNLTVRDRSEINLNGIVVDNNFIMHDSFATPTGGGTVNPTMVGFDVQNSHLPTFVGLDALGPGASILINSFVGGDVNIVDLLQRNSVILGTITVASGGVHTVENQDNALNTWYVNTNGSDDWPGSESHPFETLQVAIDAAVANDNIIIQNIFFDSSEAITITKDLNFQGPASSGTSIAFPYIYGTWAITAGLNLIFENLALEMAITIPAVGANIDIGASHCHVGFVSAPDDELDLFLQDSVFLNGGIRYNSISASGSSIDADGHLHVGGSLRLRNVEVDGDVTAGAILTNKIQELFNSCIRGNFTVTGAGIEKHNSTIEGTFTRTGPLNEIGQIPEVKVTLTQAQIQALNTTPIEVIPAPAAGLVIEVISATIKNKFNTAAFATATTLQLLYAGGTAVWVSTASFIQAAADRYERIVDAGAHVSPSATALQVTADADATVGNAASVIEIYVKYRLVDTN